MAKGQSTFRQLGKIDGRKYYQVKGVDGIVSQSINQGMSNRVKNDAAYANTRLNNAEFGGAGSTAGAITRALSQKWRYLLVPFATGKIAKDVRAIMMQDATGKWGQRGLTGTTWQSLLAEKISAYSKNSVADYNLNALTTAFNSSAGLQIDVDYDNGLHNEKLELLGCTGVRIIPCVGVLNAASYDANTGKYVAGSVSLHMGDAVDADFGTESVTGVSDPTIKVTAQASNTLYFGVAIFLPYKTVNGEDYIMQEHCSFQMIAASAAA